MKFLSAGEKIQKLREQLNITQEDLVTEHVTRGLISMIETGKSDVSYKTAIRLAEKFNEKAEKLNFILNVDEGYLMRSPSEDAEIYCLNRLKNDEMTQSTIDVIFELINEYDLLVVQAKTYFKIGEINEEKKNFDQACTNYEQAIKIYKTMDKSKELSWVYYRLGSCKGKSLQYDTAIVYFNLTLYYAFVYDDKEMYNLSLYSLALSYKKINKIDLSLETIEKYLSVANKRDPHYNYAITMKAICYELTGDYDKAIDIYKSLLEKISDSENPVKGYVYNNLGLNYCHKNDFKESLKYFEMAEKFRSELDRINLGVTFIEKSIVFLKQNLNDAAIKTIELGLKYSKEYNDIEYLIKGNNTLADIYDKSNDMKNLEKVYLEIIELLRNNENKSNLKSIYDKLALMYLKQSNSTLSEKYLLLSTDLN